MPEMNKKPEGSTRVTELEKELIGKEAEHQQEIEVGRRRVHQGNDWDITTNKGAKMFAVKQGIRMRHPDRVLHNFSAAVTGTDNPESLWEQALMQEQNRINLPQEYRPEGDSKMMVNQLGVVSTALDNYEGSKFKLDRVHMIGV